MPSTAKTWGVILIVGLAISIAHPCLSAPPDKATVLRTIAGQARAIRDLTCQLEERFLRAKDPPRRRVSLLWIRLPDSRRQAETRSADLETVNLEIGSISWYIQHPKSAQKTVWPNPTHFIPSPVLDLGPTGELANAEFQGFRDLDGESCLFFVTPQFDFWVAASDGLLRQKVQRPWAGDRNPTTFVQRFRNMRINAGLADSLFQPALAPGAVLTEVIHLPGGSASETMRVLPYPPLILEPAEEARRTEAIARVRSAFEQVSDFSCLYKADRRPRGMLVGGEPFYDSASGTLVWSRPRSLALRFERRSNSAGNARDLFVITDGTTIWENLRPPRPPTRTGESGGATASGPAIQAEPGDPLGGATPGKTVVLAENLLQRLTLRRQMREGALRLASRTAALNPGSSDRPGPAPAAGPPEGFPQEILLGAYALEPFAGLTSGSLLLDGEEILDGTATWRFVAAETPTQRKSIHWIGQGDGVPRKIQEFDWIGTRVETESILSQVRTNLGPASSSFALRPDPAYEIQDMTAAIASMAPAMLETFDVPPARTLQGYFDANPSEVTDLQGSGMAALGIDVFIRFRSDRPVRLRDQAEYRPADPAAAIDWFARVFPDDAPVIRGAASVTCLIRDQPPSFRGVHLTIPANHLHFFHAIGGSW